MDPTETLRQIRAMVRRAECGELYDASDLADLVDALDDWMSRGGFPPKQWERKGVKP